MKILKDIATAISSLASALQAYAAALVEYNKGIQDRFDRRETRNGFPQETEIPEQFYDCAKLVAKMGLQDGESRTDVVKATGLAEWKVRKIQKEMQAEALAKLNQSQKPEVVI